MDATTIFASLPPLPMNNPHVSKLTIARLFNLGNYEHVRYEIETQIPAGCSPADALKKVAKIMEDLNPEKPCSEREYKEALATLAKAENEPEKLSEWEKDNLQTYRNRLASWCLWVQRRAKALKQLDALDGIVKQTDAKDSWSDFRNHEED